MKPQTKVTRKGRSVTIEVTFSDGRITRYAMSSARFASLKASAKRRGTGLVGALSRFVFDHGGPSRWIDNVYATAEVIQDPTPYRERKDQELHDNPGSVSMADWAASLSNLRRTA